MQTCEQPIYTQLWFWLLAIGFLFFAIGLIILDVSANLSSTGWVWALIIVGIIFLFAGFFLAIWQWWNNEYSHLDILPTEVIPIVQVQKPISNCPDPVPTLVPKNLY